MNDEYALMVWLSDQMLGLHNKLHDSSYIRDEEYIKGMMDAYQSVFNKIIHNKENQRPHVRRI